ncbi:MAG: hydrogenase maturation peptidase HycI [Elusimicrobiota bacterium]
MELAVKKDLKFKNKTVIVCLGSELRADDGLGPYVGENIKVKREGLKLINAFSVIENYVEDIINYSPEKLIVVDAAFFGGKPGEIKILPEENLSSCKMISTHSFPLEAILKIIKQDLPSLEIKILGVQPLDTGYSEGLSEPVKKAAQEIIKYFNKEFL